MQEAYKSRFHCCATCENFVSKRTDSKMEYFCSRLGYATKPDYQFDCWKPKENVKNLIKSKMANKKGRKE